MHRFALPFSLVLILTSCSEPAAIEDAGETADGSGEDASIACSTASDCDDGLFCNGTETCGGASGRCADGTPPNCDDGIACTVDACVEARRACESTAPDADHDGATSAACIGTDGVPLGTDCADSDPDTFPGNAETCDPTGHDEDCNLSTFGSDDVDGDGAVAATCCNTGGLCGPDCDDHDLNVGPDAPEVCNGLNDDCDLLIDEGLPGMSYWPDCDDDGYGDASVAAMTICTAPAATPSCPSSGGAWVMQAGDCADADPGRNAGNPEVCNGIDDDCDTRIDDIIDGTVICGAGQTRSCRSTCGVDGVQACADTCLGWETSCLAPEVCNGCDDDADGLVDDGFACGRGTSSACTVPACGTSGTRVCSDSCGWGACVASESCNYCDDDGDGNFNEERPLASLSVSGQFSGCTGGPSGTLFGTGTDCYTSFDGPGSDFDLWADILDGTANNQAGALWLDPAGWFQGWGPIEVTIELEVRAISAGGAAEMPLGGWNVIVARTGSPGVGTPQARGMPSGITGIAASWFWTTFEVSRCTPGYGYPPSSDDSVRFMRLLPVGPVGLISTGATGSDAGCFSGEGIEGGAFDFDGVGTVIRERMVLRYTPDDPTTAAVDEERATLTASTPGSGSALTYVYDPTNDLPIGSGPLRIGITAGTYTQSGFTGEPGTTFGVPVRARAHIFHQHMVSGGGSPSFTYTQTVSRQNICP